MFPGKKNFKRPSKFRGSEIMLTSKEIKDIMKEIKLIENRLFKYYSKELLQKLFVKKEDSSVSLGY